MPIAGTCTQNKRAFHCDVGVVAKPCSYLVQNCAGERGVCVNAWPVEDKQASPEGNPSRHEPTGNLANVSAPTSKLCGLLSVSRPNSRFPWHPELMLRHLPKRRFRPKGRGHHAVSLSFSFGGRRAVWFIMLANATSLSRRYQSVGYPQTRPICTSFVCLCNFNVVILQCFPLISLFFCCGCKVVEK